MSVFDNIWSMEPKAFGSSMYNLFISDSTFYLKDIRFNIHFPLICLLHYISRWTGSFYNRSLPRFIDTTLTNRSISGATPPLTESINIWMIFKVVHLWVFLQLLVSYCHFKLNGDRRQLLQFKVICYIKTTLIWTRMWNMISSSATPTVCLEQKSENFQSSNVTLSMPAQYKK